MNKPDMSAFIGSGFDVENKRNDTSLLWSVCHPEVYRQFISNEFILFRPRINKPQVLDDWSWIPDGFVWDALVYLWSENEYIEKVTRTKLLENGEAGIIHASCIGVEANKDFDEWAEIHSMKLIEV